MYGQKYNAVGSNRITNMGKQYEKMNGFRCTGPEF